MKKILIVIFLCMFAYADNEINFDVVDSKGRSFWDKKFVRFSKIYDDPDMEYFKKVCDNLDWFQGNYIKQHEPLFLMSLETNRTNRTIKVYNAMRATLYIDDDCGTTLYNPEWEIFYGKIEDIIVRGDRFILEVTSNNGDVYFYVIEFINDNKIKWGGINRFEYIMCPQ